MIPRKLLGWSFVVLALSLTTACSGSDGSSATLVTVVQDLDEDPDGLTTVLSFVGGAPALAPGNVLSDGGQTAVTTSVEAGQLVVVWDERVTPSHQVHVVQDGSAGAPVAVTTTDATPPTFVISSATQEVGLGGDVIEVQFSGPRVVPALVTEPSTWRAVVGGVEVPFATGTFDFDPNAQSLVITTGDEVNLHASFSLRTVGLVSVADVAVSSAPVVGAAVGDTTAPALVSAVQRLDEDAFGRVVEFTFDEAMSPLFATQPTSYSNGFLSFGDEVEQVGADTLRVTFTTPVVPGLHTVSLVQVLDAHGNAYAGGATAITAGSTVANAYTVDPVVETVSGAGNDRLVVVTDQAFAPSTAIDDASWSLEIGGVPVDLGDATFHYALTARTLTVTLPADHPNGTAFDLVPLAVLDVDGQSFATPFSGTLDGETTPPILLGLIQNRQVDPTGTTVDVRFSEALEPVSAENTSHYVPSGGQTVDAATLLSDGATVRIELSSVAIPGTHTMAVSGATDLAGNAIVAVAAAPLTSTDDDPPSPVFSMASGPVGADNDALTVLFDDTLVADEIEDPANWIVESPIGTSVDTSAATVVYTASANTAVLTFDGGDGFSFQFGDDYSVSFTDVRDIGGNTILPDALDGLADVEGGVPSIESIWVRAAPNDNQVWVRFDEPVTNHDDSLAVYRLRDAGGFLVALPAQTPTLSSDGRGVLLTFGVVVTPGSSRLDVLGVTDLAGNPAFPVLGETIVAEDASELDFEAGNSVATAEVGEDNDVLVIEFDRVPSRWGLLDAGRYTLAVGGQPVDLATAPLSYDGERTVTVQLGSLLALQTGSAVTLGFDGLTTAQGVAMSVPAQEVVVVGGDSLAPVLPAGSVRLDALNPSVATLVDFDEAVDGDDASDVGSYLLEGLAPLVAEQLGPRTVRLTFGSTPFLGDELEANLADVAGNAGLMIRLVTAADSAGPLVTSVVGEITPGFGGDVVRVRFHKPVVPALATDPTAYTLVSGGTTLDLSNASLTYASTMNEVAIRLAYGQELAAGQPVQVTLSGIADHAGFVMLPATVNGPVSGDDDAPTIASAFVNHRESATGLVLDVLFSEDVDPTEAGNVSAWTLSGGQTVLDAAVLQGDRVRLTLAAPFVAGDELSIDTVSDAAGNVATALTFVPEP